jgi:alanine dehydrogenase
MTESDGPIWITEAEAVSLIDLGEAIAVTDAVFRAQAAGDATSLPKTQAKAGSATMHAIGGALTGSGLAAVKSWIHTPDGATPMVQLWSTADGSLLAVMEAHAMGQYRTAAMSAVATSALAAADASTMAILGTGTQALIQVAAVNAVRPLGRLTVWSPRAESRDAMVARAENALQVKCEAVATPERAVTGAAIVTLVTRATEPFLPASAPEPGTHINALGAIGLDRAEFEPELLARCATVTVDDMATAQGASRELRTFYGSGPSASWPGVLPLSEVVAAGGGRPDDADVTLFKAMGTGLADLAIAAFVYEQAQLNGLGRPLPRPARSRPRLRASLRPAGVGYV